MAFASSLVIAEAKVLYVTHEPGRWHDYSSQRAAFTEISNAAGWDLTVASGSVEETHAFLRQPDFAQGQDAIVYNFCFADSEDLAAMSNLIAQTEDAGVPALLIHCAMHSWWATFKKGGPIPGNDLGKARADRDLIERWAEERGETPMPAWGDFTGVASIKHGRKKAIRLEAVSEHPAVGSLPEDYETSKTELYNNQYLTPDVIPLVIGHQSRDEAIVMWLAPRGGSQIIGLTLGHEDAEWQDPVFRQLLQNGVNFLANNSNSGAE